MPLQSLQRRENEFEELRRRCFSLTPHPGWERISPQGGESQPGPRGSCRPHRSRGWRCAPAGSWPAWPHTPSPWPASVVGTSPGARLCMPGCRPSSGLLGLRVPSWCCFCLGKPFPRNRSLTWTLLNFLIAACLSKLSCDGVCPTWCNPLLENAAATSQPASHRFVTFPLLWSGGTGFPGWPGLMMGVVGICCSSRDVSHAAG